MSRPRIGTAREAAAALRLSTSQLNSIRERTTFEYDPRMGTTHPLPSAYILLTVYRTEVGEPPTGIGRRDPVLEHHVRSRFLVCPALFAWKLPGGTWNYNLTALERFLRDGPRGAGFQPPNV
jgi:hypothetical protein